MSRKLASVVRIAACDPVPDTERLSVATMEGKGWKVVTGRDEYRPGDLAVYFEIDSYLPADDERYAFLRDRCLRKFCSKSGQVLKEGLRIKTCRLRGVISQGLLMPLGQFEEIKSRVVLDADHMYLDRGSDQDPPGTKLEPLVGADVTEYLRVEHYDEISEALRPATGSSVAAEAMGKFPSDFIPKTDEERIQNLAEFFDVMKGRTFEVTEKNDGSSVTMFLSKTVDSENPFGVCSRNLRLKPVTEAGVVPVPWKMAEKYDVKRKLQEMEAYLGGDELALQGELVGPGINCNRDLYTEYEWHVFKMWNVTRQKFVNPAAAESLCFQFGLEYVPVVKRNFRLFDEVTTMEDLLKFAEGKTARGHEREGLVFKSDDSCSRFVSFKAVSNRYLLKQD